MDSLTLALCWMPCDPFFGPWYVLRNQLSYTFPLQTAPDRSPQLKAQVCSRLAHVITFQGYTVQISDLHLDI